MQNTVKISILLLLIFSGVVLRAGEGNTGNSGVPLDAIISDPGAPYEHLFREYQNTHIANKNKIGKSTLQLNLGTPYNDYEMDFPFVDRGFEPKEATLRLGIFYLQIPAITFESLYSDNVEQKENDRKSGLIGIVRLPTRLMVQWTEGFQFALNGELIWLPFEQKLGLSGFGYSTDLFRFTGEFRTLFETEFKSQFELAGWDMTLRDKFNIIDYDLLPRVEALARQQLNLLDQQKFDEVDRAGQYFFPRFDRFNRGEQKGNDFNSFADRLDSHTGRITTNWFSLSGSRLIGPGIEHTLRLSRYDRKYANKDERAINEVKWRETFSTGLKSVRELARFHPFIRYSWSQSDLSDKARHTGRIGMAGPLSQYTDFYGDFGITRGPEFSGTRQIYQNKSETVWRLVLTQKPQPLMWHQLTLKREVQQDGEYMVTRASYRLHRTLGPYLRTSLLGNWSKGDNPSDEGAFREWGAGWLLSYDVGPRTQTTFSITYSNNDSDTYGLVRSLTSVAELRYDLGPKTDLTFRSSYKWTRQDNPPANQQERKTLRLQTDASYELTDLSSLHLTYRFEDVHTNFDGENSYYENLVQLLYKRKF